MYFRVNHARWQGGTPELCSKRFTLGLSKTRVPSCPQPACNDHGNRNFPRERQIIGLLLQGCDNAEIARDLHIAERTVKAHFNRLFLRFGIKGGIKRVKLATLFYRRQLWQERQQTVAGPANANSSSFNA